MQRPDWQERQAAPSRVTIEQLGPNDRAPCGTPTAARRHRVLAQVCGTCGVSVGLPPAGLRRAA